MDKWLLEQIQKITPEEQDYLDGGKVWEMEKYVVVTVHTSPKSRPAANCNGIQPRACPFGHWKFAFGEGLDAWQAAFFGPVQAGLRIYCADRMKMWWLQVSSPSRSDF